MAPLGPWDEARRVAAAVSGGADSLALAVLSQAWGDAAALIVDHGLRSSSAAEAEQTRAKLAARGMAAQVLTLTGLHHGPALAARARAARYAALEAAAAQAGLVDLLMGHHAGDQAETVLMRQRRRSGPSGLAGMAALAEGDQIRRVRPLLTVPRGRLRATVQAAGLDWVEDPSNQDPNATRAQLRMEIGEAGEALVAMARHYGDVRGAAGYAATLADRASLYPEGYGLLSPGPIDPAVLALLLRAISGRDHAPSPPLVAALAATLRPATLGGVQVLPAGRLGPGWLLVREAAAMAPPVTLRAGSVWDGRFRVGGAVAAGATLGALGDDSALFRRHSGLPSAVLRSLPAIRRAGALSAVPFLAYRARPGYDEGVVIQNAGRPACGAPFMA